MKSAIFPNNQEGFILLTVIVLMALTVVIIGFMSISVSQVTSSQSVIDSIKAEEELKGLAFRYHAGRLLNTTMPFTGTEVSTTSDGKTYTSTFIIKTTAESIAEGGLGFPNGADRYQVITTY